VANTLTAVIPKLLAQGLLALRQQAIMPRLVNRSYDTMAAERGSTIDVPIPSAITATAVTPAQVPPAQVDFTPTSVPVVMNMWYEAPFTLNDREIMETMDGVIPMQASEAIKALANTIDSDIISKYKSFYGTVGTSGTTPFATSLTEYTQARTVLNRQLAPINDRRVVLNPDAEGNALLLRAFQDASFGGGTGVIQQGQIGYKVGADWWMDQNLGNHAQAEAGTPLIDDAAAYAIGVKTIHVDGLTTKPEAGDKFRIAGDATIYTVVSSTALVGTDSDITFEPGLVVAKPAVDANEVLTFLGNYAINLVFHRDAIAFATRPLRDISFADNLVAMESAVDPVSGLTLRLEITREHRRWKFSYDALWGAATVRKELGCVILG